MLKRQGVIEAWHDRQITAGSRFENSISDELERADIVLLLVSPYFLASDYCYEKEMQRALERHHRGETRVIPVILHPCDWQETEFRGLQAVPKDGTAVSKYPNQHEAFLEITRAIRKVSEELGAMVNKTAPQEIDLSVVQPTSNPAVTSKEKPRSSNLRVKKTFTERDLDLYQQETFEYISKFFEQTIDELGNRNTDIECAFKRIDANHFSAIIYRQGRSVSECKIWLSERGSVFSGICYSMTIGSDDSSINDSLTVKTDGYSLFFQPLGLSRMMSQGLSNDELSQQGAAEYYWSMLMRPVQ